MNPISRSQTTRQTALSVLLIALGATLSPFTSIPVGIAKINPTQAFINVLSAVLQGPLWAFGNAFVVALLRNVFGTGTFLAFPGSVIGALLAGLLYRLTGQVLWAAGGEIVGTGLLASWVGVALVAPVLMDKPIGFLALFVPFSLSTLSGAVLAVFIVSLLKKARVIPAASRNQVK